MDGRVLRIERKRRGLTQDQVARAITTVRKRRALHREGDDLFSITQSMISQMETGKRPIPKAEREQAQDVLEPSLHDELVRVLSEFDEDPADYARAPRGPYR